MIIDPGYASIVVCAHNGLEETTRPCIENLLDVTEHAYQLICIDDGSTDQGATARYFSDVADIPIRNTPGGNVWIARNLGFDVSNGDPIVFIDNDSFMPPGWLRILCQDMKIDQRIGIIGGVPSNEIQRMQKKPSADGLLDFEQIGGSCFAVRRKCFDNVGWFDEARINSGDTDYCYRAMDRGWRIVNTPRLVFYHKVGTTRKNADKDKMLKSALKFRWKY